MITQAAADAMASELDQDAIAGLFEAAMTEEFGVTAKVDAGSSRSAVTFYQSEVPVVTIIGSPDVDIANTAAVTGQLWELGSIMSDAGYPAERLVSRIDSVTFDELTPGGPRSLLLCEDPETIGRLLTVLPSDVEIEAVNPIADEDWEVCLRLGFDGIADEVGILGYCTFELCVATSELAGILRTSARLASGDDGVEFLQDIAFLVERCATALVHRLDAARRCLGLGPLPRPEQLAPTFDAAQIEDAAASDFAVATAAILAAAGLTGEAEIAGAIPELLERQAAVIEEPVLQLLRDEG